MGLSAVGPFQVESISQERSVSYTCRLPGLEQGLPDLLSESRLPGRPAVELTGGREDTAGSNWIKGHRSRKGCARVEWKRCGVRRNRKVWVNNKPEARIGPRVQERTGSQN